MIFFLQHILGQGVMSTKACPFIVGNIISGTSQAYMASKTGQYEIVIIDAASKTEYNFLSKRRQPLSGLFNRESRYIYIVRMSFLPFDP